MRDLEELGLLPPEVKEGVESPPASGRGTPALEMQRESPAPVRVRQGLPWFESMIDGSQLGKVKVRRGEETKDGRRVEWEIVEWTDDGEGCNIKRETSPVKRKRDEAMGDRGQADGVDAD